MPKEEIENALIKKDLEYIKKRLDHIDNKLEGQYITRVEFEPIQRLVYGMVGLILVSVIGALVSLVVLG